MTARGKRLSFMKSGRGWRISQAAHLRLAFVTMLMLQACASSPTFDSAVAAQKLAAFERDNPDCQLWTDWQSMCSRTGSNREPYCVRDPDRPVAPSEPFCTNAYLGYEPYSLSKRQVQSVMRFCDRTEARKTLNGKSSDGSARNCVRFNPDRPFSGRGLAARLHPWCEEWADSGTETIVCSNASTSNIACDEKAKAGFRSKNRLYCAKWRLPQWCQEGRDYYDYSKDLTRLAVSDDETEQPGDDQLYFAEQPPLPAPVYGIQCEIERIQ